MKILNVVGARPNFIKIAPLLEEMRKHQIESILVHTGQHSDYKMSRIFFQELTIPRPNYYLRVGTDTHSEVGQIAKMMERLEPIVLKEQADLVLVVGDVTSTLAGALVSAKLRIPLAHVEAGLRSFDVSMPEETNRILVDHLSGFLFATEPRAVHNLRREGISAGKIFHVGNVMIDTLRKAEARINRSPILAKLRLQKGQYGVVTLHRAENVDRKEAFSEILKAIEEIQKQIRLIWPMHPRTKSMASRFHLAHFLNGLKNLKVIQPVGYLDMLGLLKQSRIVLTDSGGIQEETTVLQIPCITLRENTERPITVEQGTNTLAGTNKAQILKESMRILQGKTKRGTVPAYWDGKAASRIVKILAKHASP